LRRRIDAIDDRMHDLLIERAAVVARVAASKKDGEVAFYQPGREAQILRRLAAQHRGALPFATVVRIWRELLAATVRLETPFAVAVFAPAEAPGLWDIARDHYGSLAPITACDSTGAVIRAVFENHASAGILPMPQQGDPDPWWRHLAAPHDNAPRVIARLPFGARGSLRCETGDALVIGRCAQQWTGADRTLFATANKADLGRAGVYETLSSAGLACTFFSSWRHAEATLDMFEVDGFVPAEDPRITRFRSMVGAALQRLVPLGGYAVPLPAASLLSGAAQG
jgi:chorismate mutase-like protein